tara:strand:- start:834 stop:1244 length:411 start_codon:yes stop_codon:yes gene_type:complete
MRKPLRTRDKYPDETWGSYIHRVLKGIALDDRGKDYIVNNEFIFELIKIVHSLKGLAMEQATFCGYDEEDIEDIYNYVLENLATLKPLKKVTDGVWARHDLYGISLPNIPPRLNERIYTFNEILKTVGLKPAGPAG